MAFELAILQRHRLPKITLYFMKIISYNHFEVACPSLSISSPPYCAGPSVFIVIPSLVKSMAGVRKLKPLFDRILVERFAPELKTKGGIMIPEKAQAKVLDASVCAVGPGSRNQNGEAIPMAVKVGDRVLLPEYGGTKVALEDKDYFLFREGDILAKWEDSA